MRHRKSGRHLNRTSSHRKAMFRNMAASLIEHETIKTTVAKAKELRGVIEPLITLGKTDSVANRRLAFARLRSDAAVGKLFTDVGPRFHARPGGYTRVLKFGFRPGDNAPMAIIQLVEDAVEPKPTKKKPAKKKPAVAKTPVTEAVAEEAPAEEAAAEVVELTEAPEANPESDKD